MFEKSDYEEDDEDDEEGEEIQTVRKKQTSDWDEEGEDEIVNEDQEDEDRGRTLEEYPDKYFSYFSMKTSCGYSLEAP